MIYITSVHILSFTACLALVDEIDAEVKETDPKKMIEVGSFRVDSRGNQDLRQVSFTLAKSFPQWYVYDFH